MAFATLDASATDFGGTLNYAEIKYNDIANGVGVRTSLFVSGCRHHCKGCFNEVAWDFGYGGEFTSDVEDAICESLGSPFVDGVSILGGEPLEPENQPHVLWLAERVKGMGKTVWLWTGFTFEDLVDACRASEGYSFRKPHCRAESPILRDLLSHVDVLVDGPYLDDQRDITLRFRGSPNQRILDARRSLAELTPIEWTDGSVMGTRKWMEE